MSVHYGYDDKGRLTGERQTVENPETGEMLWEHETGHAYSEQGLATRQEPDGLPPVEWLTYGSGYLAGMKLGGTPLVEYTRDRLHRETVRSFGSMAGSNAAYELTSTYTLTGQLQSRHLNLPQLDRDYDWNDNGQLIRISGPQESREYRYSDTGRLTGVHTTAANLDIDIPYATDPAGNRLPDPELHPDSTLTAWPDNRIAEDAHYVYRHDEYGRRRRTSSRKGLSGCTTSGPTTTITTASTVWCSTRGYSTANHRWRAGTSMTRWAAGRENGYGGGSVT